MIWRRIAKVERRRERVEKTAALRRNFVVSEDLWTLSQERTPLPYPFLPLNTLLLLSLSIHAVKWAISLQN